MNTFGSIFSLFRIFLIGYELGNEFLAMHYRSVDCFRLGWPMRADADFFCLPLEQLRHERNGVSPIFYLFLLIILYPSMNFSSRSLTV